MPSTTWNTLTAPRASASTTTATVSGATFVEDSFTGATSNLTSHVGENGATWTRNPTVGGTARVGISSGGSAYHASGVVGSVYFASGVPSSPDYRVSATVARLSTDPTGIADVLARASATTDDRYGARYISVAPAGWQLYKVVKGVGAGLGTQYNETLASGATRRVMLEVSGTSITLYVDGVSRVSVADSSITLAGFAGISIATTANAVSNGANGLMLDNFVAQMLDSVATTVTLDSTWSSGAPPATSWGVPSTASTTWVPLA